MDQQDKRALLTHLIREDNWDQALVFVKTRHGANKLVERLAAKKISTAALHSNKSQSFRTRILNAFKEGQVQILVATDVAARGLDITNLPYVVNYDMPATPEAYVHRIGRTGRAGGSGVAISLVSRDEKPLLKTIEAALNIRIPTQEVGGYTTGGKVPDFVLMRPSDETSVRKADKKLKALVNKKQEKKEEKKAGKAKSKSGSRSGARSGASQGRSGRTRADGKRSGNQGTAHKGAGAGRGRSTRTGPKGRGKRN